MIICYTYIICTYIYMDVSENRGTPKSSILIGFPIINHPFWGTRIFGNIHIVVTNAKNYTRLYRCRYLLFDAYEVITPKDRSISFIGSMVKCFFSEMSFPRFDRLVLSDGGPLLIQYISDACVSSRQNDKEFFLYLKTNQRRLRGALLSWRYKGT